MSRDTPRLPMNRYYTSPIASRAQKSSTPATPIPPSQAFASIIMTSTLTFSILVDSRVAQVAVYKNSDSLA